MKIVLMRLTWLISTSHFPAAEVCMPSVGVHCALCRWPHHRVPAKSLGMVGTGERECGVMVWPHGSVGAGGEPAQLSPSALASWVSLVQESSVVVLLVWVTGKAVC